MRGDSEHPTPEGQTRGSEDTPRPRRSHAATFPDPQDEGSVDGDPEPLGRAPTLSPSEVLTQAPEDAWSTRPAQRPDVEIPATIGRLEIRERIGAGAMGMVFRAYDAQLDRMVAVKLLVGHDGSDQTRTRRLRREARALARVSHPNVVQVFDVGLHEGEVFVAMELVDGQTLREWLAQDSRSLRDVLRVFIQAGEGLEAAHTAGVVHRDFKPDNVMLDERGRARVLDFGLAQTQKSATDDASLTDTAGPQTNPPLVGTPAYMAPEQILGEALDARTDVFAFCVALWEALYGQHPFEGTTAFELVMSISEQTRRLPPRGSQVPARIRKILDKGLRAEPDERWSDMGSLLDALGRETRRADRVVLLLTTPIVFMAMFVPWLLDDDTDRCTEPAKAMQQALDPDTRQRITSNYTDAHAHAAVAHASERAERALTELDEYATRWRDAKFQRCTSLKLSAEAGTKAEIEALGRQQVCLDRHLAAFEEVVMLLAEDDDPQFPIAETGSQLVHALPPLHDCEGDMPMEVPEDHVAHSLRLARLQIRALAGRYQQVLEPLTELRDEVVALDTPGLAAAAHVTLALAQHGVGELDAAMQSFSAGFDLSVTAGTPAITITAATQIGRLLGYHHHRYAEGLVWIRAARPFTELLDSQAAERVAPQLAESSIVFRQGNYARVIELLGEVLAHYRQLYGHDDPRVAPVLNDLATAHAYLGQLDEAQRLWHEVVACVEGAHGPEHPTLSEPLQNLGMLAQQRHQLEDAQTLYTRALSIARASHGERHPATAVPLQQLALIDLEHGELDRAEQRLTHSEAIFRELYDGEGVDLGNSVIRRGQLALARGDIEGALELSARGLSVIEAATGRDHPAMASALEGRAMALLAAERAPEAVELLRHAIELRRARYRGTPLVDETSWLLARALRQIGEQEQARALAQAARDNLAAYPGAQPIRDEIERWLDAPASDPTPARP